MVTISLETGAQTEARLRGVFHECSIKWLPGLWSFVEGAEAEQRTDSIADIRDEGRLSARARHPKPANGSGCSAWYSQRQSTTVGLIGGFHGSTTARVLV